LAIRYLVSANMNKRLANEHFHVYVLSSDSRGMVKVGKANNLKRTTSLARMGYAGASDWLHVASFPVSSNHEAIALEGMVIARLSNQGHKLPRLRWTNLTNDRPSFADECFSCTAEHAIAVARMMSEVFHVHVH
jgi:hypothetical protein